MLGLAVWESHLRMGERVGSGALCRQVRRFLVYGKEAAGCLAKNRFSEGGQPRPFQ